MKRKLKKLLIILCIPLCLLAILFCYMNITQKAKMDQLVFKDIDMLKVEDGIYKGTADTGLVNVEVEVTVGNNVITNIKILKHENGLGSKAEKIIDKMISMNTYKVDAVGGATESSQTIKSAVCDALLKGVKKDE